MQSIRQALLLQAAEGRGSSLLDAFNTATASPAQAPAAGTARSDRRAPGHSPPPAPDPQQLLLIRALNGRQPGRADALPEAASPGATAAAGSLTAPAAASDSSASGTAGGVLRLHTASGSWRAWQRQGSAGYQATHDPQIEALSQMMASLRAQPPRPAVQPASPGASGPAAQQQQEQQQSPVWRWPSMTSNSTPQGPTPGSFDMFVDVPFERQQAACIPEPPAPAVTPPHGGQGARNAAAGTNASAGAAPSSQHTPTSFLQRVLQAARSSSVPQEVTSSASVGQHTTSASADQPGSRPAGAAAEAVQPPIPLPQQQAFADGEAPAMRSNPLFHTHPELGGSGAADGPGSSAGGVEEQYAAWAKQFDGSPASQQTPTPWPAVGFAETSPLFVASPKQHAREANPPTSLGGEAHPPPSLDAHIGGEAPPALAASDGSRQHCGRGAEAGSTAQQGGVSPPPDEALVQGGSMGEKLVQGGSMGETLPQGGSTCSRVDDILAELEAKLLEVQHRQQERSASRQWNLAGGGSADGPDQSGSFADLALGEDVPPAGVTAADGFCLSLKSENSQRFASSGGPSSFHPSDPPDAPHHESTDDQQELRRPSMVSRAVQRLWLAHTAHHQHDSVDSLPVQSTNTSPPPEQELRTAGSGRGTWHAAGAEQCPVAGGSQEQPCQPGQLAISHCSQLPAGGKAAAALAFEAACRKEAEARGLERSGRYVEAARAALEADRSVAAC